MIDIDRLKNDVRIEDLISQSYTVTGRGMVLSTIEHDSLKIFTNNNSWCWYSQAGKRGKNLGGSTIDWIMHRDHCDEGSAIRTLAAMLDGGAVKPVARPVAVVKQQKQPDLWQSKKWQDRAIRELEEAQDCLLNSSGGRIGREYLQDRGIRMDTAAAWGLGCGVELNKKAQAYMPAILIPWQNRHVTAISIRFINITKKDEDEGRAQRIDQWGYPADTSRKNYYGKRYLCGLHLCYDPSDPSKPVFGPPLTVNLSEPLPPGEPGPLGTLFLVEGELNAISIFQTIYGMYPCDVVSFGPQSNINNPDVARMAATVASRYRRVIVWADEAEIALSALNGLPATTRRLAIRSPGGMDANDLLRAGQLDDVVFGLIQALTK